MRSWFVHSPMLFLFAMIVVLTGVAIYQEKRRK